MGKKWVIYSSFKLILITTLLGLLSFFNLPIVKASDFFTVPLDQYSNENIHNLYKDFPLGNVTFNNIPFNIPDSPKNFVITDSHQSPSFPATIDLNVSYKNVDKLYFLINSGNTYTNYLNKTLGKIKLSYADNTSYEVDIIIGKNIREWSHTLPNLVTTVTDTQNVSEIWNGVTPQNQGPVVMDLFTLSVPAEFQSKKLNKISILDLSRVNNLIPIDPAYLIFGVTINGDENTNTSPILFIPGMFSSWNTDALLHDADVEQKDWIRAPYVHEYDAFEQAFVDAGYDSNPNSPSQNFFSFEYDWRKPVDTNADNLKSFIDNTILIKHPGEKVNIVGHSMGGLIGRAYTQKYGDSNVNQLITVGSPHHGTLEAYYPWEGGETPPDIDDFGRISMGLYIATHRSEFQTPVETVRQSIPSMKDILPTTNYLKNDSNGSVIGVTTMNQQNTWLSSLQSGFPQLFGLFDAIIGHIGQTEQWIRVGNRSISDMLFSRWEDGKPKSIEYSNDGDTTVLESSGSYADDQSFTIPASHKDLLNSQDGIQKVADLLQVPLQPEPGPQQTLTPPYIVFAILSPAKIHVVGPNTDIWSEDIVVVSQAQAGGYTVTVEGTGNGPYRLEVGALGTNQENDQWTEYADTTFPGKIDTYPLSIDPNSTTAIIQNDPTGELYLKTARQKLILLEDSFTSRNLSQAISDIDASLNSLSNPSVKPEILSKIQHAVRKVYASRGEKNKPPTTYNQTDSALDDLASAYAIIASGLEKHTEVSQKDIDRAGQTLQATESNLLEPSKNNMSDIDKAQVFTRATELYQKATTAYQEGNMYLADILLFEFNLDVGEI